jgi:DNA-directed RNA polymerase beta subunit
MKIKTKKLGRRHHGDRLPPVTKDSVATTPTPRGCPSHDHNTPKCLPRQSVVEQLREVVTDPHVKSFDAFLELGLDTAIRDLEPLELDLVDPKALLSSTSTSATSTSKEVKEIDWDDSTVVRFWIEDVHLSPPVRRDSFAGKSPHHNHSHAGGGDYAAAAGSATAARPLYPRECRERKLTYAGKLAGTFCYQLVRRRNGVELVEGGNSPVKKLTARNFGDLPVMVLSKGCHLRSLTPEQLVRRKEEVRNPREPPFSGCSSTTAALSSVARFLASLSLSLSLSLPSIISLTILSVFSVGFPPKQTEMGGYFIVGGIERCIRLLQVPRRNYPCAIARGSFKNRGPSYTDLGVSIRCARSCGDHTTVTNTLHYLTTGSATLRFVARKQEFLLPVALVLRALSSWRGDEGASDADAAAGGGRGRRSGTRSHRGSDNRGVGEDGHGSGGITDEELYRRLVQGDVQNTFLVSRARLLILGARTAYPQLNTPEECLGYIGSRFRRLSLLSRTTSDVDVGHYMVRRYVLVHCQNYSDKLEALLHMLRKLYCFASGGCGHDNPDSLQNQDILLPGHLVSAFVKEKFEEGLQALRLGILIEMRKDYARVAESKIHDPTWWTKMVDRHLCSRSGSGGGGGVGKKLQHLLSTGNLISSTGLDLMQTSGYTIVAERLNFLRYCAHFRSVHRGQFFTEMKTTAVRKLLPDQWGFLCPVHTPDGGPCGLLSHLSISARVLTHPVGERIRFGLQGLLRSMGAVGGLPDAGSFRNLPVTLDGVVLGEASPDLCRSIATRLRELKTTASGEDDVVPASTEVALIMPGNPGAPYPGLYLFTCPARLVRPVLHRGTGRTELVGPLEQGFLDVACLAEDVRNGVTTHAELDPTNVLSLIANLTPFSDQNQSPRNMYQCQMGKQTMGTPCHSFPYRNDNKLYRLHTPQAPVVQTATQGQYKMDEYPNGANAIVAVLSYTGFDMEVRVCVSTRYV